MRASALFLLLVAIAAPALAQTARVALRWGAVEGAQRYELQIAPDETFERPEISVSVSEPLFRWPKLPGVPYYWRVRSVDTDGRLGDWSAAQVISPFARAPGLLKPLDGAAWVGELPRAVELAFEPQKVLREYVVQVSPDPTFRTEGQTRRVRQSPATVSIDRSGRYYWRVAGVDLEGRTIEAAPARSFEVRLAAPVLTGPRALRWSTPPPPWALTWPRLAGARSYRLEVSRRGEKVFSREVAAPPLTVPLARPGNYVARLSAVEASGAVSAASEPLELALLLGAPQLLGPSEGARYEVETPVELRWSAVPGASGYLLTLLRDGDATPFREERLDVPRWSSSTLPFGRFRWSVAALDADRELASEQPSTFFEVLPPPPLPSPQLLSPAKDEVVAAAALRWLVVPSAIGYQVRVWREGDASKGGTPRRTEVTELTLPLDDGEYFCEVAAVSRFGEPGQLSPPVRFFVGAPAVASWTLGRPPRPLLAGARRPTTLRFELLDARGRPVPSTTAEVSAAHGTVGKVEPAPPGFRVSYQPPAQLPPDGSERLTVRDRAFEASQPLSLRRAPGELAAGLRAGYCTSLAALHSPCGGLELLIRPPSLAPVLSGAVRVGLHGGRRAVGLPGAPGAVSASAWAMPLTALARAELPAFEWVDVSLGLGPSLVLAGAQVEGLGSERRLLSAGQGVLALSRPLGVGVASVEVGYLYAPFRGSKVRFQAGGLQVSVGYGVDL